ncbi:hypothetical protein PMAYCL1PPCAC_19510, partial [Pristionchus mayeri]
TYSLAFHSLMSIITWTPFRATYTYSTVIITSLRLSLLRSKGKFQASYSLIRRSSLVAAILTILATVPNWMATGIGGEDVEEYCDGGSLPFRGPSNVTVPYVVWADNLYDNGCLLFRLDQVLSGIVHYTLPSFFLLLSTIWLIYEWNKANKLRLILADQSANKSRETMRTSSMMIVIAVIALLSEFPLGVAYFASALLSVKFQIHYTDRLVSLFTMIQVCSTATNILVLLISKNFRMAVFRRVCFWRKSQ